MRDDTAQNKGHFYGFTLLELLVVGAIIGLLAALLFPVFNRVRESGRKTVCLSGAHGAALGLAMYAHDYDGVYPTFRVDPTYAANPENYARWHDTFCQGMTLSANQPTWLTVAQPYLSSPKQEFVLSDKKLRLPVLYCPSDTLERNVTGTDSLKGKSPLSPSLLPPITSYEFKMWLAEGRQEEEIVSPTQMVILWEQRDFHTAGNHSEHDRRAALNAAFVDGHVRRIRLSETNSAKYGDGPDLHWAFVPTGEKSAGMEGLDVTR